MEVKKVLRKVVAVAAGATMMGATLFSALAATDLGMYPEPFVKDGQFDGFIVVGDNAAAEDVVGAVDIGASLQFEMRKETTVSLGSADVLISEGVKIKGTGSEVLNYNESIGSVRDTPLDEEDLPVMLAEGRYAESEGATDNDETYTQELWLNNSNGYALHDQPDEMDHDDYLELLDNEVLYRFVLEFDDPVEFETSATTDGSREDDIEGTQIEIQGNIYTITDIKLNGTNQAIEDMTLMAGETLIWLMQDQVIEKTVAGVTHEIKVVDVTDNEDSCGVAVDNDVAWIDVNSDKTINGVNIGILDAKAVHAQLQDVDICEVNIGATEIKIENAETSDITSIPGSSTIEIDGQEVDDAEVAIVNAGIGTWDALVIEFTPDDDIYLAADESFTDPVLQNFKFLMGGVATPREEISLKTSGSKKAELKFTNNDGKLVTIPLFVNDTETGYKMGEDDDEPLLKEGDVWDCGATLEDCDGVLLYAITSGETAHVLEITSLDTDDTSVDLRDLTYGRTFNDKNYSAAISLGSLGSITLGNHTVAGQINATNLDVNDANRAETNYGAYLYLANATDSANLTGMGYVTNDTAATIFKLTEEDIDDADIGFQNISVQMTYDAADDDELETDLVTSGLVIAPTGGVDESEDNSDVRYYTTTHGTLIAEDDEDKDWIIINYPQEEVEINAFVAPVSAQISTSGGAVMSLELEKLNVGAARLASEISDVSRDNLILVGGACANAATAAVQGLDMDSAECLGGLEANEAVIKLYEQSTGKVAMVVAGRDALDTRRATRVIANFAAYDLSGSEAKVTGTSLTDIRVSVPS